jgi:hypothetical protein
MSHRNEGILALLRKENEFITGAWVVSHEIHDTDSHFSVARKGDKIQRGFRTAALLEERVTKPSTFSLRRQTALKTGISLSETF